MGAQGTARGSPVHRGSVVQKRGSTMGLIMKTERMQGEVLDRLKKVSRERDRLQVQLIHAQKQLREITTLTQAV